MPLHFCWDEFDKHDAVVPFFRHVATPRSARTVARGLTAMYPAGDAFWTRVGHHALWVALAKPGVGRREIERLRAMLNTFLAIDVLLNDGPAALDTHRALPLLRVDVARWTKAGERRALLAMVDALHHAPTWRGAVVLRLDPLVRAVAKALLQQGDVAYAHDILTMLIDAAERQRHPRDDYTSTLMHARFRRGVALMRLERHGMAASELKLASRLATQLGLFRECAYIRIIESRALGLSGRLHDAARILAIHRELALQEGWNECELVALSVHRTLLRCRRKRARWQRESAKRIRFA